jgi:hypothetical protein
MSVSPPSRHLVIHLYHLPESQAYRLYVLHPASYTSTFTSENLTLLYKMLWKTFLLVAICSMATPILSAPAPQRKVPSSQQLNCTPNGDGAEVCCDQFGGCIFRNGKLRWRGYGRF